MSRIDTRKQKPLADEEIVSSRKVRRRSLLLSTGIAAVTLVASSVRSARAGGDDKELDQDIPTANSSDPDKDY